MAAINEYSGVEFPGAVATLEPDLDGGDCSNFPSLQLLAKQLQGPEDKPTTIRFGRGYTEATTSQVGVICSA